MIFTSYLKKTNLYRLFLNNSFQKLFLKSLFWNKLFKGSLAKKFFPSINLYSFKPLNNYNITTPPFLSFNSGTSVTDSIVPGKHETDELIEMASSQDEPDLRKAEKLLRHGGNPNAKNLFSKVGNTILILASNRGHRGLVELLLRFNADPNTSNIDGFTPLHNAAFNNQKDTIGELVKGGAYLNDRTTKGETPLHIAAKKHQIGAIKVLAELGADIYAKDEFGETPYSISRKSGFQDAAQILIDHALARELSKENPSIESIKNQVSKGANVNRVFKNNSTPISKLLLNKTISEEKRLELLQFLTDKGANINQTATEKYISSLLIACGEGNSPASKLLIKNGADPLKVEYQGRTAWGMAEFSGNNELANYIKNTINKKQSNTNESK